LKIDGAPAAKTRVSLVPQEGVTQMAAKKKTKKKAAKKKK